MLQWTGVYLYKSKVGARWVPGTAFRVRMSRRSFAFRCAPMPQGGMHVCLTRKRVDRRARLVLDSRVSTTDSGRVVGRSMTILTAHKILIASAVALFLGYAVWELLRYPDLGGPAALVRSGLSAAAAIGLGIYLRAVFRRGGWVGQGGKPPGQPRR